MRYGEWNLLLSYNFDSKDSSNIATNFLSFFFGIFAFAAKIEIGKRLAVMFFIHGGGFFDGDGSDQFYGADHFMEKERQVILVTINYRLGPFGFANLDDDLFSGNMGLKDQAMALEWVYNNIHAFHGDRNCITVFGQSAGK